MMYRAPAAVSGAIEEIAKLPALSDEMALKGTIPPLLPPVIGPPDVIAPGLTSDRTIIACTPVAFEWLLVTVPMICAFVSAWGRLPLYGALADGVTTGA